MLELLDQASHISRNTNMGNDIFGTGKLRDVFGAEVFEIASCVYGADSYDERCLAESGISPLLLVTILYPSYGRRDNSQMKIFRFRVGARF